MKNKSNHMEQEINRRLQDPSWDVAMASRILARRQTAGNRRRILVSATAAALLIVTLMAGVTLHTHLTASPQRDNFDTVAMNRLPLTPLPAAPVKIAITPHKSAVPSITSLEDPFAEEGDNFDGLDTLVDNTLVRR
ncbi:hypothetical protein KKF84_16700 [Myxococcota bacterium]|nr:hypothetical protein [Myxococcota bacterium]MBU1536965.1 hypothetical protein [Myxococcota bacterium]